MQDTIDQAEFEDIWDNILIDIESESDITVSSHSLINAVSFFNGLIFTNFSPDTLQSADHPRQYQRW